MSVVHTSRIRIEKHEGPHRTAHVENFEEPINFGIHAGLVIGDQRNLPADLDFDSEGVEIFRNGELAASGIAAEIMGGPLNSLRWLANHLLRHGERLEAGQLVIPGSAVELISVGSGDRMTASFTRIGSVSAAFAE